MNKFDIVKSVLESQFSQVLEKKPRLLDVGCRDCTLGSYLNDIVSYEGVDLFQNNQNTVSHVIDVSHGLPFPDGVYDFVVSLDMVEHIDDINSCLEELLRVSKRKLIIMLPNMAFISHRISFLIRGRFNTDKYDLIYSSAYNNNCVVDRHRWLTTQQQSDAYMTEFSKIHDCSLTVQWITDGYKKTMFAKACRLLGISPQLWAWSSLYVLTKTDSN